MGAYWSQIYDNIIFVSSPKVDDVQSAEEVDDDEQQGEVPSSELSKDSPEVENNYNDKKLQPTALLYDLSSAEVIASHGFLPAASENLGVEDNSLENSTKPSSNKFKNIAKLVIRINELNHNNHHVDSFRTKRKDSDLFQAYLTDFDIFETMGHIPRCPDTTICVPLASVNRSEAMVIMISHCWFDGNMGKADDPQNSKYKLIVSGIRKLRDVMVTGLTIYIWLDYTCIDQNSNAVAVMSNLKLLMQYIDCIFTPIIGVREEITAWSNYFNYYENYVADGWNRGERNYVNSGWCRLEMFYAANVPLIEDLDRLDFFKSALKYHASHGRRPHILYGSYEENTGRQPIILPPLQNSYFEQYDPRKGRLSYPQKDLSTIQTLVDFILPTMKFTQVGWEGARDEQEKEHGHGVFTYSTGDIYTGEYLHGVKHGFGIMQYSNGAEYKGGWKNDLRDGTATYTYATGEVFEGSYQDDLIHGFGIFNYVNGNKYTGDWSRHKKHGQGTFSWADGRLYQGEYRQGLQEGYGRMEYPDGSVYEGAWSGDKRHGRGILTGRGGETVEGTWEEDVFVGSVVE